VAWEGAGVVGKGGGRFFLHGEGQNKQRTERRHNHLFEDMLGFCHIALNFDI
jgi:hypothetical protein